MECVRLLWIFGLLFSLLTGCQRKRELGPPKAVEVREDGALELVAATYNLRYEETTGGRVPAWTDRVPKVVRRIRSMEPAVLGIQEALHGQAADLWASLPEYEFYGVGRQDGRRAGEYAGLFFLRDRFEQDPADAGTRWLSDTPNVPGSHSWGNEHPRIVTWTRLLDRSSGRGFYVFNTHLDHRHQGSREQAALSIARQIDQRRHPEEPVILLGDFNAVPDNPAIAYLRGSAATLAGRREQWRNGLLETFRAAHPGQPESWTLLFWGRDRGGLKVDHILVSRHASVLEASVLPDEEPWASDHLPVRAVIRFP